MNIRKATESYEKWKSTRTQLIKPDLEFKHQEMAVSAFAFFRATFYRWVQLWPEVCPSEAKAPNLLAVGDLHVENFGTWRDLEGRLIWGVNDFDEVYPMAYTIDLVRLAVSAHLAVEEEHLRLSARDACDAILEGYRQGLAARGKAFVLAEENRWLRLIALNRLRDPVRFWKRAENLEDFRGNIPAAIKEKLEFDLPEKGLPYLKKRRVAGLGSLVIFASSLWLRGAAAGSREKPRLSRLPRAFGRKAARNPRRIYIRNSRSSGPRARSVLARLRHFPRSAARARLFSHPSGLSARRSRRGPPSAGNGI